jgi:hypothetical protein
MAFDLLDHTDAVDAYTDPSLALRDNVLSRRTLRDGSLGDPLSRHFVPGYDR